MRISLRELMLVVAVAAVGLSAVRFASSELRPAFQLLTGALLFGALIGVIFRRGASQSRACGFLACAIVYAALAHRADSRLFSTHDSIVVPDSTSNFFLPTRLLLGVHKSVMGWYWSRSSDYLELDFDPVAPIRADNSPTADVLSDEEVKARINEQTGGEYLGFPITRRNRGGRGRRGGGPRAPADFQVLQVADQTIANIEETGLDDATKNRALLRSIENSAVLTYRPRGSQQEVIIAGHCLFMLAIAFLGGHFAAYVHRRRTAEPRDEQATP